MRLGIETLENKDVVLTKLGLFFLLATNLEKILAEYILEKTKNDKFRNTPLGTKEVEFNRITNSFNLERYRTITSKLKNFRERRNDITHKTLVIDPKHFEDIFYINRRNEESSDEISVDGYVAFINDSIIIGRNLLTDLVTLFLFEDLADKDFDDAKIMLTKKPFGFHNKHC
jgi:hypothetical protein